ncbi:Dihydrolipoamide dehydrogenase of branched-chain alpha-keto acid dehydrogenase [Candidatus Karelsulcia muelleri]|uniref:Dihydrolipoyl dehydrogenase n=1 Tax=Candidatus Karelsulcia muelleri TaxID=336810 RepID=A0A654MFB5_9FLAO|nr:dihydrolipoyl dehydrogenase [Candidatus Karelsulcia muelleri]AGS33413.1 Dihydrolipoamide dehydrogenase of branched-chain alpha-keto acid dehydrogenase [Candidatus Karelsulcia muelleri str. Sulcia-ALF]ALP70153.1 Dihydrolipoamide dehydrogenase of branched-chain alpha-keto acid dehydrogenase [Candidatus Karelsulcia muelleri]QND78399.1 Dihydrolipoyl dehydrogenase [Candidatus Karelsulcia muelleri]
MYFDLIIIGSGPGGYVAAIRAAQLGLKTAIVEKENLGGVCLNWGCIPTKSLLKSANIFNSFKKASKYGIITNNIKLYFKKIILRSRYISDSLNKGVLYLIKKNNIKILYGEAKICKKKIVSVIDKYGNKKTYNALNIIIATGAKYKIFNTVKKNKTLIGYREAMLLKYIPKNILIIGSGAIGLEFAYFYNKIGSKIFIIEKMPNVLPFSDIDISIQLENSYKKYGIIILKSSIIKSIEYLDYIQCTKVILKTNINKILYVDIIISAIGICPNTENLGLEEIGITLNSTKHICVDKYYSTNVKGYYAIGDVIPSISLAHVASYEGIICVEKITGLNPLPLDYNNVPMCIYSNPEISSVGFSEKEAINKGYKFKIGKFPFTALGKAKLNDSTDGFIKVIIDDNSGELLGCHMIGSGVTELISEIVVARKLETTSFEFFKCLHPHPTISESVVEAITNAYNQCIHI